MSEQPKPKSYWAQKQDKVDAALKAAPGLVYEGMTADEAMRVTDALEDQGLLLMPRSDGYGKWRVLVDGKPAPYAGSRTGEPAGPMGAEEAAEAFLLASAENEDVTVRPATGDEMVISAVLGDPVVKPDPVKLAVVGFNIQPDLTLGALALTVWDKDGNTALLGMDDATREDIAEALKEAL
jgi:hypothetical protein